MNMALVKGKKVGAVLHTQDLSLFWNGRMINWKKMRQSHYFCLAVQSYQKGGRVCSGYRKMGQRWWSSTETARMWLRERQSVFERVIQCMVHQRGHIDNQVNRGRQYVRNAFMQALANQMILGVVAIPTWPRKKIMIDRGLLFLSVFFALCLSGL